MDISTDFYLSTFVLASRGSWEDGSSIYCVCCVAVVTINTWRPRQNGRHFPDDSFKWIFLNENVWISIKISLNFVPKVPINNIPALVQIMAWRRSGDKPLSESMVDSLLTHICVIRPQWVNSFVSGNMTGFYTYKFQARIQHQNHDGYGNGNAFRITDPIPVIWSSHVICQISMNTL